MFSCLQILESFLWFVLITLLNLTLIILTLSVSRLLNLLLRLVAFLLFLNPQCLASISRWITASSSWKRFCLFVCRALSSIMVICMLMALFFSIRRRHTRCLSDWSSDVCSSDLCSLAFTKRKTKLHLQLTNSDHASAHGGQLLIDALCRRFGLWERVHQEPALEVRTRLGAGFSPVAMVAQLLFTFTSGGASLADAARLGLDRVLMRPL